MNELVLAGLVFAAVGVTAYVIAGVAAGAASRRLRNRLSALADVTEAEASVSAIRARYLRQLSPVERTLEEMPGMELVSHLFEQAGWTVPAYRVAMLIIGLALGGAMIGLLLFRSPAVALLAGGVLATLPILKARVDRAARLEKFETQLPDALDLMSRSLRAGNPLMESFKFVSDEMKPPIAEEFGRAWSNVNYGVSLKASLADLLDRVPSVSLRSLATAILVQRETGGNLAEILDKITHVLRGRAKFQRRLKTLTAEGRLSAWVLALMPLGFVGVMSLANPKYMPILFESQTGQRLLIGSAVLMVIGMIWVSRMVKIRV